VRRVHDSAYVVLAQPRGQAVCAAEATYAYFADGKPWVRDSSRERRDNPYFARCQLLREFSGFAGSAQDEHKSVKATLRESKSLKVAFTDFRRGHEGRP
jgi:hypothetical protein